MRPMTYIIMYLVFYLLLTVIWKVYELVRFEETYPDPLHTIIAVVLALSLTFNVMFWKGVK